MMADMCSKVDRAARRKLLSNRAPFSDLTHMGPTAMDAFLYLGIQGSKSRAWRKNQQRVAVNESSKPLDRA